MSRKQNILMKRLENTMMCNLFKKSNKVMLVLMVLILTISMVGCGNKSKQVVGEYIGSSGSFLKLGDDGSCVYAENDKTGTGTGTWKLEEDKIIIKVSNLDYVIYADKFDKDGLLLKADSNHWSDEYFSKTK